MYQKRPYLFQKLITPEQNLWTKFGGGLPTGGIPSKQYKELTNIFDFDYMGAAEYEFGSLGESYTRFKKDSDNIRSENLKFQVSKKENKLSYKGSSNIRVRKVELHVLYRPDSINKNQCIEFIEGVYNGKYRIKAGCNIKTVVSNKALDDNYKPYNTLGWWDINNDMIIFIDEDVKNKTLQFFKEMNGVDREKKSMFKKGLKILNKIINKK